MRMAQCTASVIGNIARRWGSGCKSIQLGSTLPIQIYIGTWKTIRSARLIRLDFTSDFRSPRQSPLLHLLYNRSLHNSEVQGAWGTDGLVILLGHKRRLARRPFSSCLFFLRFNRSLVDMHPYPQFRLEDFPRQELVLQTTLAARHGLQKKKKEAQSGSNLFHIAHVLFRSPHLGRVLFEKRGMTPPLRAKNFTRELYGKSDRNPNPLQFGQVPLRPRLSCQVNNVPTTGREI